MLTISSHWPKSQGGVSSSYYTVLSVQNGLRIKWCFHTVTLPISLQRKLIWNHRWQAAMDICRAYMYMNELARWWHFSYDLRVLGWGYLVTNERSFKMCSVDWAIEVFYSPYSRVRSAMRVNWNWLVFWYHERRDNSMYERTVCKICTSTLLVHVQIHTKVPVHTVHCRPTVHTIYIFALGLQYIVHVHVQLYVQYLFIKMIFFPPFIIEKCIPVQQLTLLYSSSWNEKQIVLFFVPFL